jgi:hypothetical protein
MSKRSTADKLLGLLIASGFMLLITALPAGIFLSLHAYYQFHADWHLAVRLGVVMATITGVIGVLFLCVGEIIVKRRAKNQKGGN